MIAHTPTPWHVRHAKGKANRAIFDAKNRHIITVRPVKTAQAIGEKGTTKKLAAFVCRAVNAHDGLVEALTACRAALGITDKLLPLGVPSELAHKIERALKQAEGGQ